SRFHLATAADEIHLHPEGLVLLEGYGQYRTYYKEGLDRFGIQYHVFRVGDYKSAVEPYVRNDMSEEAREANLDWLGDVWTNYLQDVAAARSLDPDAIARFIEEMPTRVRAEQGDIALAALENGLVDQLSHRDAVRDRLIELVGRAADGDGFRRIGHAAYVAQLDARPSEAGTSDGTVGVIVARGTILDGEQPPGTIGGDTVAKLVRQAREDDDIAAIVLRVDSGGGSAFASEVIRRELALARDAGKPVVVSMGSVAASGGYWIATSSDEIWASPSTITGSIGIFGLFPTIDQPLNRYLGMNVDGVGTTSFAGALRPDRPLEPKLGETIQLVIEDGYRDFLERVANAREMTIEEVDAVAGGRVWSGEDAQRVGLVDQLGDLDAAIASAGQLAALGDDPRVTWVAKELTFQEQLFSQLAETAVRWRGPAADAGARWTMTPRHALARFVESRYAELAMWNDPRGVYAHCLCEIE
ncbi:MAG: signal peptide peptidase SppA, partial [Acidobacteriota bacterium]